MQFDRMLARLRVVNAGSVGMPFAGPPGAYWLLLADGVHLRRTAYDVESTAQRFRSTGFPHVEALAVRYVLNPPMEAESLEMLTI
jgi:diadenosine tetraphosphatase ApaH/serine/threonine PP2A family protein phosphatase